MAFKLKLLDRKVDSSLAEGNVTLSGVEGGVDSAQPDNIALTDKTMGSA